MIINYTNSVQPRKKTEIIKFKFTLYIYIYSMWSPISEAKTFLIDVFYFLPWDFITTIKSQTLKNPAKRTAESGMVDGDFENGRREREDDCKAILWRLARDKQIAQESSEPKDGRTEPEAIPLDNGYAK